MEECCRRGNPFLLCSGLRVLGYAMILLVAAIVGVSYYAVVVLVWGPVLLRGGGAGTVGAGAGTVGAGAIVAAFHLLLALLVWSYLMAVMSDPGSVPANWGSTFEDERLEMGNPGTQSGNPSVSSEVLERRPVGFCNRCRNAKPPRCHHCSVCQRCVLKMDHHCIWVVNCVGARNYKFFLLFLVYTFLETVLDVLVLLPHFIKFFGDTRKHSSSPGNLAVTFLAFVLNLAFAMSLLCFLVMHASLLLSNTTSIEVHEKKKGVMWKYNLGKRKNFEQVFGSKKLLWLLPLFSKDDLQNIPALQGLNFPVRLDVEA